MLIKLLGFIYSIYIITPNQKDDCDNQNSGLYSFISLSGVHYYLFGDASTGIVFTAIDIDLK
jgi:hypothetical protein